MTPTEQQKIKSVYFAHCMADYGQTKRQRAAIDAIARAFPRARIVSPDSARLQEGLIVHKKRDPDIMAFFREQVRLCDTLVALPWRDGYLTAGVAVETLEALIHEKPVYLAKLGYGGMYLEPTAFLPPAHSINMTRQIKVKAKEQPNG